MSFKQSVILCSSVMFFAVMARFGYLIASSGETSNDSFNLSKSA